MPCYARNAMLVDSEANQIRNDGEILKEFIFRNMAKNFLWTQARGKIQNKRK